MTAGQHQFAARRRRREGQAPAIGMEHRHRDQQHVARGEPDRIGLQRAQRVQIVGAVGVDHALGAPVVPEV
jgi:hypothetical protein